MAENKIRSPLDVPIWEAVAESIRGMDAKAWPGTLMFLLLIAIETGLNMVASLPEFGWIVAVLVALLFGVFISLWHIITSREQNSTRQQTIAETSVSFVGGLSIALLIVNLIRILTNKGVDWNIAFNSLYPTSLSFGGWDILSILIISVAFGWHLYAYLSWHNNDQHRISRRNHANKMAKVNQKEDTANLAIRAAEAELLCIEAEETKVAELSKRFAHLPANQLQRVLDQARREVRHAFEKDHGLDLDGDGHIGEPANIPAYPSVPLPQPMSAETELVELDETNSPI